MKLEVTNENIKLSNGVENFVCTYNQVPDEKLPMILESEKSLLQEINLDDMLINLTNSSELLYIAFCALNGKTIQAELDGLQVDLLKLCAKSKATMTTFRDQSKEITLQILGSYKWMRKGMVDQAKLIFDSTAEYASQMAQRSQELAKEFDNLATQTTGVLKNVEVKHGEEIKDKEKLQNDIKNMEAERIKQTKLAEELSEDLVALNIEYQEEKEAAKDAEKKEMTMAIVSAITGAISLGIGALVNAKGSQGGQPIDSGKIKELNEQKQSETDKQAQLTKQKEADESKLTQFKDACVDLENQLRTQKEILKNKTDVFEQETDEDMKVSLQKDLDELNTQIKDLEHQLTSKKEEIKHIESSLKDYTAELSGITAALQSITKSIETMQKQAQSAAEAHSQKVSSLLEKKLTMEKEKRESLAEIEKFAVLIKNNGDKVMTTDTAIQMLVIAIRCLKKVVSSLIAASYFWESLKQYCEKLSQSTISKLLDSVKEFSKEDRIEFFADEDFVFTIVTYASQWAAMYYVSDKYYKAANETYLKTDENFKKMSDQDQARKIALENSSHILSQITIQKRNADKAVIELQKQIEEQRKTN